MVYTNNNITYTLLNENFKKLNTGADSYYEQKRAIKNISAMKAPQKMRMSINFFKSISLLRQKSLIKQMTIRSIETTRILTSELYLKL